MLSPPAALLPQKKKERHFFDAYFAYLNYGFSFQDRVFFALKLAVLVLNYFSTFYPVFVFSFFA
jgi:hypothetical protein